MRCGKCRRVRHLLVHAFTTGRRTVSYPFSRRTEAGQNANEWKIFHRIRGPYQDFSVYDSDPQRISGQERSLQQESAAHEANTIHWIEDGASHSARWRAENGSPPPKRVVIGDDRMTADAAYRLACEGTAILWRGDFQNARQLLQALARRADRKKARRAPASPAEAFHFHRQAQSQRARTLGMLLLPFDADYAIPLRRAPDVRQACLEAYGPDDEPFVASLRELLGLIGAHEWRKKGVPIAALNGERIHPHYGVFSPVRGEYVELVAKAPLPSTTLAFDIGAGTGVLSAVLARRGVRRIVATDMDPRALGCTQENILRLGLADRVAVTRADLFPEGRAPLIVCNPPWVPARPSSAVEQAVYDPESKMLLGFLGGLAAHLEPGGEGWLILSDFAEHLGLRPREFLLEAIAQAGLVVAGRMDIRPVHPRASDPTDPLHAARAAEVTSLWRLAVAPEKG
jgi:methylase of polypeptide subunit release factors